MRSLLRAGCRGGCHAGCHIGIHRNFHRSFRSIRFTHRFTHHTAKSKVLQACIWRRTHACTRSVARAVAVVAQERTAAMHTTFRRVRFVRIETRLRSRGIHCHAIRANFSNARCICVRSIEIHRPLPHISSHVIQPVAIGGKTFHHRCTRETIVRRVLTGKLTLPCVATLGEQLITHGLIAPHIDFLRESSARRILPLGFRRQSFARPLANAFAYFSMRLA